MPPRFPFQIVFDDVFAVNVLVFTVIPIVVLLVLALLICICCKCCCRKKPTNPDRNSESIMPANVEVLPRAAQLELTEIEHDKDLADVIDVEEKEPGPSKINAASHYDDVYEQPNVKEVNACQCRELAIPSNYTGTRNIPVQKPVQVEASSSREWSVQEWREIDGMPYFLENRRTITQTTLGDPRNFGSVRIVSFEE